MKTEIMDNRPTYVNLPQKSVGELIVFLEHSLDAYFQSMNIAVMRQSVDGVFIEMCRMYSKFNELSRQEQINAFPVHQFVQIDMLDTHSKNIRAIILDSIGLRRLSLSDEQSKILYSTIINGLSFKNRLLNQNVEILDMKATLNN